VARGARQWLDERGYDSTLDYVRAMAIGVLEETGLLPHLSTVCLFRSAVDWVAVVIGNSLSVVIVRLGLSLQRRESWRTY